MSQRPVEIPESVIVIARQKAKRFTAGRNLPTAGADDVAQSLLVNYLRAAPAFDPAKGAVEAFARTVFENAASNLFRDCFAAKRSPSQSVSLQATVKLGPGEFVELAAAISQQELSAWTGCAPLDGITACDLKIDVAEVLATFPPADRDLLHRLKWKSIATVARELGIPDTTLHSRVSKFRQIFEDAGLREYLA
jgi:RNA polymerase sigma factor (sigma-70 family)